MSYEKLIEKLKKGEQNQEVVEETTEEYKMVFLDFNKDKTMDFRLLPNKKDPEDVPFERVFIHLGFEHPNYEKKVPLKCKGKDCPMCAYYKKRDAIKDPEAWRYKSNQRFIYYVETMVNNELRPGMLSLTYYAHEEFKNKMISQLKSGVNIFDINDGRWISMTRKKMDEKIKYMVTIDSEEDTVSDVRILEWYEKATPLHEYYQDRPVEDLKKIIKGEKLELKDNKKQKKDSEKEKTKSSSRKFATDEVDSIDDDIAPVDPDSSSENMQRLEEILNRSDESDFEEN